MFGKLFSKKREATRNPDKIWRTGERKRADIVRIAKEAAVQQMQVVLVAHFRETFTKYQGALQEAGIHARSFSSSIDRLTAKSLFVRPSAGAVALFLASALPESAATEEAPADSDVRVQFIVVERYPLPTPDRRVEALADTVPHDTEIEFHGAFDEPLFRMFGAERLLHILDQLGVASDECISHAAVSKAVHNAQEKIAEKVLVESPAASVEEWMKLNIPE